MYRKDEVGAKLKEIRKQHGLTGPQLAKLLNYSQAGVSKIENGLIKPSIEYVSNFADSLNLSFKEREALLTLTKFFLEEFDRWSVIQSKEPHTKSTEDHQREVSKLEGSAKQIRVFEWSLMYGLLQTRRYAHALFRLVGQQTGQQLERTVEARIRRQRILDDSDHSFNIILAEQALRTVIGSPAIVVEQLDRLLELLSEDKTEIRILPANAEISSYPCTGFVIYDHRLVVVESQTMVLQVWSEEKIGQYVSLFNMLHASAVGGRLAKALIQKIRKEYRSEV